MAEEQRDPSTSFPLHTLLLLARPKVVGTWACVRGTRAASCPCFKAFVAPSHTCWVVFGGHPLGSGSGISALTLVLAVLFLNHSCRDVCPAASSSGLPRAIAVSAVWSRCSPPLWLQEGKAFLSPWPSFTVLEDMPCSGRLKSVALT